MIICCDSLIRLLCSSREGPGVNQYKAAPTEARQRRTACSVEKSYQPATAAYTDGEGECEAARYLSEIL